MATYNGAEFISEQLESIRIQTMPVDEVLIRDDGSSDETESIVKEFINKYNLSNWKITKNKINLGWRENFSQLLNEAKGEIIFLSDQDDIWEKTKIEKMTRLMLLNEKIDVLVSDYDQKLNENRNDLERDTIDEIRIDGELYKVNQKWKNYKILRPGWTYAVRGKFISQCYNDLKKGLTDKGHDALLWRGALSKDTLYHCKVVTGTWRMHESSAISSETKKGIKTKEVLKYINSELKVLNRLVKLTETESYKRKLQTKIKEFEARRDFLTRKNFLLGGVYLFRYRSIRKIAGDTLRVLNWKE
jgi:glycosyltransferase involved in cell wall biosynthesis